MGVLVLWLLMGGVVAVIANSKGFDTFGWLIYGALIWPIALAHVIVKPAVVRLPPQKHDDAAQKKCPDCAEMIKADAVVCRFCGNRSLSPEPSEEMSAEEAWFASLERTPAPKPQPTTWQRLWWNPHADR